MKRWWIMLLVVLAGVAARGQVIVETNDVLALDPLANPHTLQAGAPVRLTVYATQAGAALPLTGYTGQWAIVDTADGATVATYTGALVGANAMRFAGTVGAQLRVGGSYEAAARVYSGGALVGQISASQITVAEGYCSTCKTVIVTTGGAADGGVTNLYTSGSVAGSIVGASLWLTGLVAGITNVQTSGTVAGSVVDGTLYLTGTASGSSGDVGDYMVKLSWRGLRTPLTAGQEYQLVPTNAPGTYTLSVGTNWNDVFNTNTWEFVPGAPGTYYLTISANDSSIGTVSEWALNTRRDGVSRFNTNSLSYRLNEITSGDSSLPMSEGGTTIFKAPTATNRFTWWQWGPDATTSRMFDGELEIGKCSP